MSESYILNRLGFARYGKAIASSLLLHVSLLLLLVLNVDLSVKPDVEPAAKIIDAVVIDSSVLEPIPEKKVIPKVVAKVLPSKVLPSIEEKNKEITDQQAQVRLDEEKRLAEQQVQKERDKQKEEKRQVELQAQKERDRQNEEKRQAELQAQKERDRQKELQRKNELKKIEALRQEELAREQAKLKAEEEQAQQKLYEQQQAEQAARAKEALASELAILRSRYQSAINQKISRNWIKPVSTQGGDQCEILINQIPGGEVINVIVESCRGDSVFQRSVENAVGKVSPLPYEGFEKVFDRNIRFIFRAEQ